MGRPGIRSEERRGPGGSHGREDHWGPGKRCDGPGPEMRGGPPDPFDPYVHRRGGPPPRPPRGPGMPPPPPPRHHDGPPPFPPPHLPPYPPYPTF